MKAVGGSDKLPVATISKEALRQFCSTVEPTHVGVPSKGLVNAVDASETMNANDNDGFDDAGGQHSGFCLPITNPNNSLHERNQLKPLQVHPKKEKRLKNGKQKRTVSRSFKL